MNIFKSACLTAAAIFVAGVALTNLDNPVRDYFSNPEPAVVTASPGGEIFGFMDMYGKMRVSGQPLEIRGVCASACTFFFGLLPKEQVCYDSYAMLGFHGVYSSGFGTRMFNQPMTEWTYNYTYTPEVIEKIQKFGWSMEKDLDPALFPTNMLWMGPEIMEELGYQECA